MTEKKTRGRPRKSEAEKKTVNKRKNDNVQMMILRKIGLDDDISDIFIELAKEFNINKKYFYIGSAVIGLGFLYFKNRNKTEPDPGQENITGEIYTGENLTQDGIDQYLKENRQVPING